MHFSWKQRQEVRFDQNWDIVIIGGGITGAAVARDATSRGLKVLLLEKKDFAYGTSSRSSKLMHGGLRYLENFEFRLVFEALSERARYLHNAPHLVKPLPFYMPMYNNSPHSMAFVDAGLWLYDILSMFHAPGLHARLSKKQMLKAIPFIASSELKGGFRYFDASMLDDILVLETLRSAYSLGATTCHYAEVTQLSDGLCTLYDHLTQKTHQVKTRSTVLCLGPWLDTFMHGLNTAWKPCLKPSQGVHLIIPFDRLPVIGAVVMAHPTDGRISFVIPRGNIVIVGTTDSPITNPDQAQAQESDITYLLGLLHTTFPECTITNRDIISTYVGVRPLMQSQADSLQKVSREHTIQQGPWNTVLVTGGKYTTNRSMAEEIVDFTISTHNLPSNPSRTKEMLLQPGLNPETLASLKRTHAAIPEHYFDRFGLHAIECFEVYQQLLKRTDSIHAEYGAMLTTSIRYEMTLHLTDFYLRRSTLYLSHRDHGLSFAPFLADILVQERQLDPSHKERECTALKKHLS